MRSQTFYLLIASLFLSSLLSAQVISGDRAASLYPGAATVRLADENPVPQFVQFHPGQHFDAAAVFSWLQKYTPLDEHTEFRLQESEGDRLGMIHHRYHQYYRGVPVQAGVLLLHERDGRITSINGEMFALTGTAVTPGIDCQDMIGIAVEQNPAQVYAWEVGAAHRPGPLAELPDPQLTWVSEGLTFQQQDYRLAYEVDIYAVTPHIHRRVWLDASTGRELAMTRMSCGTDTPGTAVTQFSGTRPIVAFETTGGTFESRETGRGDGIETYDGDYAGNYATSLLFVDDDNTWTGEDGRDEGMECHYATEQYYDLLLNEFDYNSIDNDGFALISYTRFQPNFANAFWNGEVATYGSGAPGSVLDQSLATVEVVAHEFTHGLTEFSAGLIYNSESGALNESFSDVFGLYLDWKVRPEAANWTMGDESTSTGAGIRSAEDPNIHGNPDTYDGDLWFDGAGVHTNSGVQNHWYQILSDGETGVNDLGDAYEVEGVGIDVAAQIAFRNLTVYLTPSSNYADASFYAQLAATDLYGRCSSIWTSNANAWYAVGLGSPAVDELSADFSATTQFVCEIPGDVTFLNTSSYAEDAMWDFGDGTMSTEWAPTHSYTAAGIYDVSLIVSGCEMGMDTIVREGYIVVDPEAEACDTIIMATSGITEIEACNGTILDPGGSGNYSNGILSTLTVTSPQGTPFNLEVLEVAIESGFDNLSIYDGPDASAPLIVNLSGTNYDPPFSYTTTGGSFTFVFDTDGSVTFSGYMIQFTSEGSSDPPVAGFSVSNTTPELSEPFTTIDASEGGGSVWYDFGDGTTLFGAEVEHRYLAPGEYTIAQYVENCQDIDTAFVDVTVQEGGTLELSTDTICVSLLTGTTLDSSITVGNIGPNAMYYDWPEGEVPDWLTVTTTSGMLNTGEEVTLPISFAAGDLVEGDYTQDLILNAGDETAPQTNVHLKMTVIGIPDIFTEPNPQDFGEVFVTVGAEGDFKIYNNGTAALEITSWSNNLSEYTFSVTPPLTVPPYDSMTVTTTLTPAGTGILNDVLTMQTNAGTYDHVLMASSAPAPIANVDPMSVCVTVETDQTTGEVLSVFNTGGSTLEYEWLTSGSVLVWMYGVDDDQEGQMLLDGLASELPDVEVIVYNGESPTELAGLLANARVLVMPESEFGAAAVFEAASPVIQNFVNAGGGLVHSTGGFGDPVGNVGVFTYSGTTSSFTAELTTLEATHPLLEGVDLPVFSLNLTTAFEFTSPDRVDVLSMFEPFFSALSAQQYGGGRAVYIGYDYFETNATAERILANAVNWAGQSAVGGLPSWLTIDPLSGTVGPGENLDNDLTFDATDLLEGTYETNLILSSNDPANPEIIVEVKMIVIGVPEIFTEPNPQDFGEVFNTVVSEDEFTIYNQGTGSLEVTSWSNSLSEYTFSVSPPFTIPPLDSLVVTTTLTPTGTGVLNDVLTMETNAGTYDHVLMATSAPAPIANVDPLMVCVTLEEGQTDSEILSVFNTGGSTLDYEWLTSGSVLVWMYGVDDDQEGQMLLDGLAAQLPDAEVIVYNGDSPTELADLLSEARVLVMPESEFGNAFVYEAAGETIRDFVNAGGGLVHSTGGSGDPINSVGVFTGEVSNTSFTAELTTLEAGHPLLNGVALPVFSLNLTTAYEFTSPNRVDVLSMFDEASSALSAQTYGAGRAVYVGYDYFESNETGDMIIANAVIWAGQSGIGGLPSWLTVDPLSGSVGAGDEVTTDLTFDATDLEAGEYVTILVLSSNDPATPTINVEVKLIVEATPRIEFSAAPLFSCDGVVEFTDESLNAPTSWLWTFGDGSSSTEQNPTHTYTESGIYDITLEACNDLGCDELTKPAYVQVDLLTSFCDTLIMQNGGDETLTGCTGFITDSGGADGNYPNNFASVVSLQPVGATSVAVTVEDFRLEGCCDFVRFFDGPDTSSPSLGVFNGTDLVPGDVITSTGGALTIQFTTDASVTFSGFVFQYQCAGLPPVADFDFGIVSACGNTVNFANQSENGIAYLWDFGDGVTSTQQNPTHGYSETGNYTVMLTTTNELGSNSHGESVSIGSVPFDLGINMPEMAEVNTLVTFSPITSASLVDYMWELGEGNFFNQETAFNTFTETGTYIIRLRGTDADGCEVVVQRELIINLPDNVEDLAANEHFLYYPNPSDGELFIDLSLDGAGISELRVVNPLGQLVRQTPLDGQTEWQQTLDLTNLPAGTYLLEVRTTDGRRITGRWQKMK